MKRRFRWVQASQSPESAAYVSRVEQSLFKPTSDGISYLLVLAGPDEPLRRSDPRAMVVSRSLQRRVASARLLALWLPLVVSLLTTSTALTTDDVDAAINNPRPENTRMRAISKRSLEDLEEEYLENMGDVDDVMSKRSAEFDEDEEEGVVEKRAVPLSINQDLHALAASVREGPQGERARAVQSLYRLGKRGGGGGGGPGGFPLFSFNQDARLQADAFRRQRVQRSLDTLQR